jgi:hypothetical protein
MNAKNWIVMLDKDSGQWIAVNDVIDITASSDTYDGLMETIIESLSLIVGHLMNDEKYKETTAELTIGGEFSKSKFSWKRKINEKNN